MEFEIVKYLFVGINCAVAFLIVKTGLSLLKNIEKKIKQIKTDRTRNEIVIMCLEYALNNIVIKDEREG